MARKEMEMDEDLANKYMNLWPQIGQLYMKLSKQNTMPVMTDEEVMEGINKMIDKLCDARACGLCTNYP